MDLDGPDLCLKRTFCYDVVEGKLFTFTTKLIVIMIQIELLLAFLKSGRQLRAFEDFWTQFGLVTGPLASSAVFNRSFSHILVSVGSICFVIRCKNRLFDFDLT